MNKREKTKVTNAIKRILVKDFGEAKDLVEEGVHVGAYNGWTSEGTVATIVTEVGMEAMDYNSIAGINQTGEMTDKLQALGHSVFLEFVNSCIIGVYES